MHFTHHRSSMEDQKTMLRQQSTYNYKHHYLKKKKKACLANEAAVSLTFAWTQILVNENLQLPIGFNQTSLLEEGRD